MRTIMVNTEMFDGSLEDALFDTGSGFVASTNDGRTILLNEIAAYILKNCHGKTFLEIVDVVHSVLSDDAPGIDILKQDIDFFINQIIEEGLGYYSA